MKLSVYFLAMQWMFILALWAFLLVDPTGIFWVSSAIASFIAAGVGFSVWRKESQ